MTNKREEVVPLPVVDDDYPGEEELDMLLLKSLLESSAKRILVNLKKLDDDEKAMRSRGLLPFVDWRTESLIAPPRALKESSRRVLTTLQTYIKAFEQWGLENQERKSRTVKAVE